MKNLNFLFVVFLLFSATTVFSQITTEKITVKNETHFITPVMNYPIYGTYFFEGDKEPIVHLNQNGLGTFQQHDLSKSNIMWGIECSEHGSPIAQKGFNYAVYTLWYRKRGNENEEWTSAHFSIHFQKKKIFILGERSKDYTDEEMLTKS